MGSVYPKDFFAHPVYAYLLEAVEYLSQSVNTLLDVANRNIL